MNEETEQRDLIRRANDHLEQYPELAWLHHVPNGGYRGRITGAKMKAAGVKPGVLDLSLPAMRLNPAGGVYGGYYCEMKRTKGSTTSPAQKKWIRYLRGAGYAVALCKGVELAWSSLMWYLSLPPVPALLSCNTTSDAVE